MVTKVKSALGQQPAANWPLQPNKEQTISLYNAQYICMSIHSACVDDQGTRVESKIKHILERLACYHIGHTCCGYDARVVSGW